MNRITGVAVSFVLVCSSMPAQACFLGPRDTPRTLSLEMNLPSRVVPSVVIQRGAYSFYISAQAMDSMLADPELSSLLPSELRDAYGASAPLEQDMPVFEMSRLESDDALSHLLAYAIGRTQVAITVDGIPVESITRVEYDNGCQGGRNFLHDGNTLIEVVDWAS